MDSYGGFNDSYGNDFGGGYLQNAGGTGTTPQKKGGREYAKVNVIPGTIAQILSLTTNQGNDRAVLDGREISIMKLICRLHTCDDDTTPMQLWIGDNTASSMPCTFAPRNNEARWRESVKNDIGYLIEAYIELKPMDDKMLASLSHYRRVSHTNAIPLHMLEVINAHLTATQTNSSMSNLANDFHQMSAIQYGNDALTSNMMLPNDDNVREAVLAVFRDHPLDNGRSLEEVKKFFDDFQPEFAHVSLSEIHQHIESLSNAALLFSVDEDHWSYHG